MAEGGAPAVPRTGRDNLGRFGPGRRELLVFVALVLVGFVMWFASSPGFTSRITGLDLPRWPQDDSPLGLFFVPAACGALALVGGFVFPKGFYLWGVALGLHGPFVEGLTVHYMYRDGIELVGGTPGILSYVAISATMLFFTILCYTLLSSVGAGVRYLLNRSSHR